MSLISTSHLESWITSDLRFWSSNLPIGLQLRKKYKLSACYSCTYFLEDWPSCFCLGLCWSLRQASEKKSIEGRPNQPKTSPLGYWMRQLKNHATRLTCVVSFNGSKFFPGLVCSSRCTGVDIFIEPGRFPVHKKASHTKGTQEMPW